MDISNKKFGKLTAIQLKIVNNKIRYWYCKCDCGNGRFIRETELINGNINTCGCDKKEKFTIKEIDSNEPTTATVNSKIYKPYLQHTKGYNKFSDLRNGSVFEYGGEMYMKIYDTNCSGRYNAVSLSTDKYISIDNEQIINIL